MAMALKPDERRFLTWVSQAVKTNPFTELREALDLKIAGCDAVSHPPDGTPAIVRDMAI